MLIDCINVFAFYKGKMVLIILMLVYILLRFCKLLERPFTSKRQQKASTKGQKNECKKCGKLDNVMNKNPP